MSRTTLRSTLPTCVLLVALGLGAGGCASDEAPSGTPSTSSEPTTAAPTTAAPLPGEPFDAGPQADDVLAVVGVRHDDVLDLQSAPGPGADVVAELEPLEENVVALGEGRMLADSIWYRVTVNGDTGWVDSSSVQYLGEVDDVTARIIEQIGSTPQATDMVDLGLIVAEQVASTDPPSRIVLVAPASLGFLGEVTYDVVGLGDDSVGGFRLHVFGTPGEAGFGLKSVEQTLLCLRGVTDGICV